MPLFGSKTEVGIDLDRTEVVVGETVRVRASFGELDKKAQGARVELLYRNRYKEDDTDSDGDRTTTTTITDVVVAKEELVLEGGTSPGEMDVELAVPADAPGTAGESVRWAVRAVVDRKRARDANAEAALTVLSPADPYAAWAERPADVSPKCPMAISPDRRVVGPGDRISGTLVLHPRDAISARGVRVQLRRERNDPDRNSDCEDVVTVELCGPTELAPGEERSLPFSIDVPADAEPSFRAAHNEQHWYLQGVIDVKRSGDPTVRLEVVVHTA